MKIIDTFGDFVAAVDNYVNNEAPKDWRIGQAVYNLLNHVRPDLTDLLDDSEFDPFYDDSNIPAFYDFIYRHWDDMPEKEEGYYYSGSGEWSEDSSYIDYLNR